MKTTMIVGIILIVLGVAGLAFQGISYTTREKVIDIGGLGITAETRKTIPVPLIAGALVLVAGIGTVVVASRKS
ncbi:MAG: DUF3185 domain-containing protein [Planctomycetota bacterium]